MKPENLIVAPQCLARLGIDGLARLAAALHPRLGECQTCVQPLGGAPTSLTIDLIRRRRDGIADGAIAVARLHHATCTPSRWNDSDVVVVHDNAATYSKTNFLITGPDVQFPMVVLNPGLDMVFIAQFEGLWTPLMPSRFRKAGMIANLDNDGWPPELTGVTGRMLPGDAIQIVGPTEYDLYPQTGGSAAPPEMMQVAREQRRLFFVVTYAINPADIRSVVQLQQVMDHPLSLVGTVRIV